MLCLIMTNLLILIVVKVTRVAFKIVANRIASSLQTHMPRIHSPLMNVRTVNGRIVVQSRKSATAKFTTNAFGVVLNDLSFQTAIKTSVFPQTPSTITEHIRRISTARRNGSRSRRVNCGVVDRFIFVHELKEQS